MSKKISYGIGAIGKDMVYALVAGFILYYYNTVLGISGTFTGIMMMAARIFDALNDPFMGIIVEKTNTRWGKFRPWIFSGTVLNALVMYGMFSMPSSITGTRMLIYASVAYVLWGVTYTMMDIPFWSMIPALTETGKERENLTVVGRTAASVGFAIPTVLTMLIVTRVGGSERAGFAIVALAIAILFVVTETICVMGIKEQPYSNPGAAHTVRDMFKSLFTNDQALLVVVAILLFTTSLDITSSLALYFFKYDLGNSDLFGLFGMIGGVAQILSMMSLPVLRKKWSSKSILTGAIGVTVIGYIYLFFLATGGSTSVIQLGIAAFIIYVGFGLSTVLTTVFLADSVDYGELKTGQRNESVIFSMQTFIAKFSSAISVLIAGVGIDLIGLDVNAKVQAPGTLIGLRLLMLIAPIIGIVVSVLYFRKNYKLTEEENERIAKELSERRKLNSAT